MLVDKNKYKELIKEEGNRLLKGGNAIVEIVSGTNITKGKTCNLYVYSNGIYLDASFREKEYIDIETLIAVDKYNKTIELCFKSNESIEFKFTTEKSMLKVYALFDCIIKARSKHISLDESFKIERELVNEQRELEKEIIRQRKLKDREELKTSWEAVKTTWNQCPLKDMSIKKTDLNEYDNNVARCPKCGSTSLTANKKGFSATKGVIGLAVSPLAGAIAGSAGRNKVMCTCLKCGHQWKAGK